MRRLSLILAVVLIVGCHRSQRRGFDDLSDAFFQWYFKNHPVAATMNGRHMWDDRFGDFNLQSERELMADLKRFDLELTQIDPRALRPEEQIDYQILSNAVAKILFELSVVNEPSWNTALFPEQVWLGLHQVIIDPSLQMTHKIQAVEGRLESVGRLKDQLQNRLRISPEGYLTEAKNMLNRILLLLDQIPLMLNADNAALDRIDALIHDARVSVSEYDAWLDDFHEKHAKRKEPLAPADYGQYVELLTHENIHIREVADLAAAEIRRLQNRMLKAALPIYLRENDEPVWVQRSDTLQVIQWALNAVHENQLKPEKYAENFQQFANRTRQLLETTQLNKYQPQTEVRFQPFPEYYQPSPALIRVSSGPLSSEWWSLGWVQENPNRIQTEYNCGYIQPMPKSVLQLWFWQNLYPGRILQERFQRSHEGDIRKVFRSPVTEHGWQFYSAWLMTEKDPAAIPNGLTLELLYQALKYAVLARSDVLVHLGEMTIPEAQDEILKQGFCSESAAVEMLNSTRTRLGESVTRFLGYSRIQELRSDAVLRQADRFDEELFHLKILSAGSIPFHLLKSKFQS